MAKKNYGWYFSKQPAKPTEKQKAAISESAKATVEKYRADNIPPRPDDFEFGVPIDVYTKWWRSYFYFYVKYEYPEGKNYIKKFDDFPVARLEFREEDKFNISYFRHTGQWWELSQDQSLADCLKMIENDPWFKAI